MNQYFPLLTLTYPYLISLSLNLAIHSELELEKREVFIQYIWKKRSALVSILKLGGRLLITFFEIFQIKYSYVVNSKKVGDNRPPHAPL